ncbi:hypothetical protein ACFFRR_005402 [Megaselia abdita]
MAIQIQGFLEPRGIIRILQFVFSIVAFATTSGFSVTLEGQCTNGIKNSETFHYPFMISNKDICPNYPILLNVSSDCQFFVATGVLSFLYCIFIIFIYLVKDELYQSRKELPMAVCIKILFFLLILNNVNPQDFILTVILAVFWLSGSAAWSNGASQMKSITDVNLISNACKGCTYTIGSFGKLNSSLIVGFLNFFLWTSNLWFIYKETIWFTKHPITSTA